MQTTAKIILDSVSPKGHRLTTMEVTFHRFVLAEFNTHRVFSRNSASSRAIPFSKQVLRVIENPALPVEWRQKARGMQGGDELENKDKVMAIAEWINARNSAIKHATKLDALGVHKSIVNRLLEPFMWHTVIVTATEYSNFYGLRCNVLAQPEIQVAAYAMRGVMEESIPTQIDYGQWHTPLVYDEDTDAIVEHANANKLDIEFVVKAVAAARSARVSYLTHDGTRDIAKDMELFYRLSGADPMHASPFEHVATPVRPGAQPAGNFEGWEQWRHRIDTNTTQH